MKSIKRIVTMVIMTTLLCTPSSIPAQDPIYNPQGPIDIGSGYGYVEGAGLAKDYYLFAAFGSVILGAYLISLLRLAHQNGHAHSH